MQRVIVTGVSEGFGLEIAKFLITILELPKNMEISHIVINRK